MLTHLHILLPSISGCFAPCSQGVDGHKVWVELTVGVGEHSSQFGNQFGGTILTGKDKVHYFRMQFPGQTGAHTDIYDTVFLPYRVRGKAFGGRSRLRGCCPR